MSENTSTRDLPTYGTHPTDARGSVTLDLADHVLRVAIESVLRIDGVDILDEDDGQCLLLSDNPQSRGKRVVLMTEETPAEAHTAMLAFTTGAVGAIASRRKPEAVPMVIMALRQNLAVLPQSLLAAAVNAPRLSDRHQRVLSLTVEGLTNAAISRRLGISEATVKRDVTSLLRAFGCATRTELVRKATENGYS
jgi:DNA-binding NarL/FixJ family response regulator